MLLLLLPSISSFKEKVWVEEERSLFHTFSSYILHEYNCYHICTRCMRYVCGYEKKGAMPMLARPCGSRADVKDGLSFSRR